MKNKTYYRLNIFWQLLSLFMLTCGIGSLYSAIIFLYAITKKVEILSVFCLTTLLFTTLFCIYAFLRLEHNRIVLNKEFIFVPDDWMWKEHKIQFKTIVKYSEIIDIKIIKSHKNSNNKTIKGRSLSNGVIKPYLEITLINNEKKRIFIMYFTRKQKMKIINELLKRMELANNPLVINDIEEMVENSGPGGIVV